MRRIGVLTGTRPEDAQNKDRNAAFEQALEQLGWTSGRSVRIDYRFSGGDPVTSRKQAEELVALAPDVILSTGSLSTGHLLRVTQSVPVVFTIVPDPVPDSSTVCRSQVAMLPASCSSNMASVENGLNYSRKSHPVSREQ